MKEQCLCRCKILCNLLNTSGEDSLVDHKCIIATLYWAKSGIGESDSIDGGLFVSFKLGVHEFEGPSICIPVGLELSEQLELTLGIQPVLGLGSLLAWNECESRCVFAGISRQKCGACSLSGGLIL